MSKKNIILSAVFAVLTVIFLVLMIRAGGADAGFTPLTFVFGFLTFKYVRNVLDQKKGITREKKLPTVATIGLVLVVSLALSIASIFIGANLCYVDECDECAMDGFSYCEKHKCANDSCDEEKLKSFEYCDLCKCKQKECPEYNDDNVYCDKHECSEGLCEEIKDTGEEFCIKHKDCYSDNCTSPKIKGFNYCEKHKCAVSDCEYDIGSNLKYCGHHVCGYGSCNNMKVNGGNSCNQHKCLTSNCKNAREEGKSKCSSCIAREEAEAEYREENAAYLDELVVNTGEKQIWKIYVKDGYFKMKANYEGTGNFIVTIDDSNQDFVINLCNEIGDYKLDKTVSLPEGYYYLEIKATYGSWSGQWYGTYGQ